MDNQQTNQNPPQGESIESKIANIIKTITGICNNASIGSAQLRALKDIREIYEIAVMDANLQMQGESEVPSPDRIACSIAQNNLAREINDRRVMMQGYANAYDSLLIQGEQLLSAQNELYQSTPNEPEKIIPPEAVSNELARIIEEKVKR